MVNKSNFDNSIKQELALKASEAKPSNEMLSRIINRIEDYEGGKENMFKYRFSNIFIKRLVTVSLCAVLVIAGVTFTFSDEVRAATMDVIRTIFVLDKTDDGYAIVEKTTEEALFQPGCSRTSELNDTELTEKLGFNVRFSEVLYGEYKLHGKAESVVLQKLVSEETSRQLEPRIISAINDQTALEGLADYNPFRSVFATYLNTEKNTIFIAMRSSKDSTIIGEATTAQETNVGDAKATWYEQVYPNYAYIDDNGIGRSDLYSKPDGIIKKHALTWESNGVIYNLSTYKDLELTLEDAVKIAESFMAE